jgi:hypothetical protein
VQARATLGAHCRAGRDQAPMIESRNVGRTTGDFQCRVRIINGLFVLSFFGSSSQQFRSELLK